MTGNTWRQRAGETDLLVGEVQVLYPDACDADGQYTGYASVVIYLDGDSIGSAYAGYWPGSEGRTQKLGVYFYPSSAILSSDSDADHLLTAKVLDGCAGTGQDFTFDTLKIDVIAAR